MNVNRKRVQGNMREMGIVGICPGPNISKSNTGAPDLSLLTGRRYN